MSAKIKSLRTYTDCIRAESQLNHVAKELENFSEWYCQFYFEEKDYENYIDEARKLIEAFADGFKVIAENELEKAEASNNLKYPRIKTWKGQVLIVMKLDEKGAETTDWYSLNEIRQMLKEQKEEKG